MSKKYGSIIARPSSGTVGQDWMPDPGPPPSSVPGVLPFARRTQLVAPRPGLPVRRTATVPVATPSAILYSGRWHWRYVQAGKTTEYDSGNFSGKSKPELQKQAASLLQGWLAQAQPVFLTTVSSVEVQAISDSGQVITGAGIA